MSTLTEDENKLERIAEWLQKVKDGEASYQSALLEIEAICNE